jgi:hypothetical protein
VAQAKKRRCKGRILKGEYQATKCKRLIKFRSGLELQFIVQLEQDPTVVAFDYECFIVPYKRRPQNSRLSKYIPDFVVWREDGTIEVVEIKPSRQVTNKVVATKAMFATQWCESRGYKYLFETEKTIKVGRSQAILIYEKQKRCQVKEPKQPKKKIVLLF